MSRALSGTCYRASNWPLAGADPRLCPRARRLGALAHHGQPKEIFVFELTDAAAEALSRTEVPAHWNAEQHTRANGGAAAAQPVRVSGRGARVPP